MVAAIKLPDMGTNVEECKLLAWRVREGEHVTRGQILADIETDKVIAELESTAEGVVLRQMVGAGTVARTGDILAYIGQPGEAVPEAPSASRAPGATQAAGITAKEASPSAVKGAAPRVSIGVRNLAAKENVDLAKLEGSGPGGIITREDVLRASRSAEAPQPPAAGEGLPRAEPAVERLLSLYRKMTLIRQFEERVKFLFLEGVMPGTIHQYNGQEAIAVGVCGALQADDVITSTHRPHGHALARGLTVESLMHELFGKSTGCCRGKGGSMHVGDLEKGMVPAIAIVGSNVPIATGIALAFKMRKEARVAVSFMGDGGVNEGQFHEGVNMGAVWSLPVVYVIENNLYSASTPIFDMVSVKKLSDRAAAYGIPGVTIDGNDVLKVLETAQEAVEHARRGQGPTLIECRTYRITGHSRRDPGNYQPEEERKMALENEPIRRFASYLISHGVASEAQLESLREENNAEIEQAVKSAMAAPLPAPEDALKGLYV